MINADSEIITIIVGADASQSEAKAIAAAVGDQHPDLEFEIHQGDQPVYPYFVLVEIKRLPHLSRCACGALFYETDRKSMP